MKNTRWVRPILMIGILLVSAAPLLAQFQDSVPRGRLVSDAELLALLDSGNPAFSLILEKEKSGNTDEAIQLLGQYLQQRTSPAYFFDPREVTSRVDEFKDLYPEYAGSLIRSADDFMEAYGTEPMWKMPGKDLLGRAHTPNTVRNIARQPMAAPIALAYHLTGDEKYRDFYLEIMRDFIASYEAGDVETGENDVFERFYAGHRLRNWLFAQYLYMGSGGLRAAEQVYLLKVYLLHGARLIDDCNLFHYGNHQLHGLAALYEMTVMYPELPVMNYWNAEALRVIMEHVDIEIKPDGFQFERASHYFKFDIVNYLRIYLVAGANDRELPELYHTRFKAMFDAMVSLSKPNRDLPVLMDAQAEYSDFTSEEGKTSVSHDAAELADPTVGALMAVGSVLYKESDYRFFGEDQFPPDFFWFFTPEMVSSYGDVEKQTPSVGSVGMVESGYYVMRSGWDEDDLYMLIDGGLAEEKPDHTHGQQLGVIAYANGAEILPNYRVRYSDPSYRTMKNSAVKNIALADGVLLGEEWHSNHARTGFGIWKKLPSVTVNKWESGQEYDFFSGSHNAYDARGIRYERSIIFFKPLGWIINDRFESEGYHDYQQLFQGEYAIDDQYNRAIKEMPGQKLYVLQADPTMMEVESKPNFWTHSVVFNKENVKTHTFNTLVMPVKEGQEVIPDIRLFERDFYRQVLVFAGPDRFSLYFKKTGNIELNELKTDAAVVATRYKNEKLYSVYIQDFTHCQIEGYNLEASKKGSLELVIPADGKPQINPLSDCGEVVLK